ncbi:MAG: DUF3308 domain-containing protein [Bacteroidetes bacterium]|nr:MAG: DUF3308 domain-containing protein [Bacteroidota bacterium]
MKTIYKILIAIVLTGMILPTNNTFAGNKDRSGEAGATELLINPWARSSGWGSVGTAYVQGLEGMFVNVAGTAFTQGTEVIFSNTTWLKGTETNIMAFGVTQKVGESGVLGLNMMNMSFGELNRTTEGTPDANGGMGTFSPSLLNIGVSYAKIFSNSIYGGMQVKLVSESTDNLTASGIAIDAGIQYVTGPNDNIRFGITLRNWGTKLSFNGDGLAFRVRPPGQEDQFTLQQRAASYELPSQMNIGVSYDFLFNENHTLTAAANFRSNAFTNDQFTAGLQYKLMSYLMLRAAYTFEPGIMDEIDSGNKFTVDNGLSAGASVEIPLNKESGTVFAVDYAFRSTAHFNNTHSIGARISF